MPFSLIRQPYELSLDDVDVRTRIETIESVAYSDAEDGTFEQVVRIRGRVLARPDETSVADAVGLTIASLLDPESEEFEE